jgi:UDP-N-acetylglucosamine 2-epimerase/glycosyl transferase family 2
MELKGKKAFCFLALKHHSRFLLPVTRALEAQGMEILYLTAPAEMPFELTLQEEGLPYRHTQEYLNQDVVEKINVAYRSIRSVWKEKVLQSAVLNHFTLPVQDKILRMHVDNFYLFRRMFEVEKPDLVLALHELNSWGKMLGYLSHDFGVPMITLQEGLYYAPAAVYRFHTEYSSACLVWGEATREVLVRSGGSSDKIFVIGNTHLQTVIKKESDREALRKTKQELTIGEGQKVVTLLMGGLGYDKGFTFPQELLDWVRAQPELVLICKWHPVTNKLAIEQIGQDLSAIPNVRTLQQFDTYRLLAASDVCVVFGNSTTGLEALAFGKPLLEVQLSGLEYSFARHRVAGAVATLAEIPQAVDQILKGIVSEDRQRHIDEYLRHNLYLLDEKAVHRSVRVVERMLSARGAKKPTELNSAREEKEEFLCSIIIPQVSCDGVPESLLGVADNIAPDLSYECLISSSLAPEERGELVNDLEGDVQVLSSDRSGLSHLYNLGASRARGRYLCFLTPGWVPQKGWLETFVNEMEQDPRVGIVGGMALFGDGLVAHAGIAFDANLSPVSLYRLLPAIFSGANRRRNMRGVTGCLFVRREAFLTAGGFDETFQGNWSELDFCLQTGAMGWTILYTPESLFVSLETVKPRDDEDRLSLFAKWVGSLWPDQDSYWAEDQLDPEKLADLYRKAVSNLPSGLESLTPEL